ncbi:hypothetical protein [Candidatus Rhodobacter oscarellae]|nr:hypothetical protein [Candidatus Rhodobacter lobularis]
MVSQIALDTFRTCMLVQTNETLAAGVLTSPINPQKRPYTLSLSNRTADYTFRIQEIPEGELSLTYFSKHFGFEDRYSLDSSMEIKRGFDLFLHELSEVQRGTNASSKYLADERSLGKRSDSLWRGMRSEAVESGQSTNLMIEQFGDDFEFWREWYQGVLHGTPIDWELQKKVASIGSWVWEAGPEAVAEEIEKIKADFLVEKSPLAEKVEFNEVTGKFNTVPQPIAKPELLGATLSQVEDALEDCLAHPSNGLSDRSRETRDIRRTLTRYANDPQRIEMNLTTVATGLRRQLETTEELPKTEENLVLQDVVEQAVRGIRATHPEVAENRKILAEQALKELPQADKKEMDQAKEVYAALTEGVMAEDFSEDIPVLLNDAILPPSEGAPRLSGADPATRIFYRTSKMAELVRKYPVIVEKIEKSPAYKTVGIVKRGLTVAGWLSIIVGIGLRAFGVL